MVCKIASKIAKYNIDEVLELIALAILDYQSKKICTYIHISTCIKIVSMGYNFEFYYSKIWIYYISYQY